MSSRQHFLTHPRALAAAFGEHRLSTHAGAIAFRVLVALVPLTMLALALLGAFGLEDVWGDTLAPAVLERFPVQVYAGIDFAVRQIFRQSGPGLIAFAAGLLLWHLMRGVRAITNALNEIHAVDETRRWPQLVRVSFGLALAAGACVIGATLVVIVGGRMGWLAASLRWPVAVALLGLAVALLVRYAPTEQPETRWASVGSGAIVAGWILLSLGFGVWVTKVADYESAAGSLLAFLVLTAYVLAVSTVFLLGVELDELLRKGRPARRR
jgi:membrane protein